MKKKRNEMQMRIGANNKELKRISNDFYATDPAAIDLEFMKTLHKGCELFKKRCHGKTQLPSGETLVQHSLF